MRPPPKGSSDSSHWKKILWIGFAVSVIAQLLQSQFLLERSSLTFIAAPGGPGEGFPTGNKVPVLVTAQEPAPVPSRKGQRDLTVLPALPLALNRE